MNGFYSFVFDNTFYICRRKINPFDAYEDIKLCSSLASRTRVKTLNKNTVKANARFFDDNTDLVPRNVLTIGIATIMDAKEVMIIASGDKKAKALHCAIEGSVNHMCPVSILQMHPHALIVCDEEATSELKAETVRYFKENEEVKMPQKRR